MMNFYYKSNSYGHKSPTFIMQGSFYVRFVKSIKYGGRKTLEQNDEKLVSVRHVSHFKIRTS